MVKLNSQYFYYLLVVRKSADLLEELHPHKPEYPIEGVILAAVPQQRQKRVRREMPVHFELVVEDVHEEELYQVQEHVLHEYQVLGVLLSYKGKYYGGLQVRHAQLVLLLEVLREGLQAIP
jgi:hypothetical protein